MRVRIIDAFTDRPYAGNPAVVVLLDGADWPADEWMQRVAAEFGLSETAFARPLPASTADWGLRWFTPVVEDDLCGHATLATAHALASDTPAAGARTIRFATRSGVLPAHLAADGSITLDLPAAPAEDAAVPPGLVEALGATPVSAHTTGRLRDLLVVLPDEDSVRTLDPDSAALAAVTRRDHIRGITATAAAAAAGDYDFVSRFFSPADGLPEDPVTGSAHTALAPFWAGRLGRDRLTGLQASRRSSLVHTEVHGDRVHVAGRAVTVLDGTWLALP